MSELNRPHVSLSARMHLAATPDSAAPWPISLLSPVVLLRANVQLMRSQRLQTRPSRRAGSDRRETACRVAVRAVCVEHEPEAAADEVSPVLPPQRAPDHSPFPNAHGRQFPKRQIGVAVAALILSPIHYPQPIA